MKRDNARKGKNRVWQSGLAIRDEGQWRRCLRNWVCVCSCVCVVPICVRWRKRRVRMAVDGMRRDWWRLFLECRSPIKTSLSCDVTGSSSWQQGRRVNYLLSSEVALCPFHSSSIALNFRSQFPVVLLIATRSTAPFYPPDILLTISTNAKRNSLKVTAQQVLHTSTEK